MAFDLDKLERQAVELDAELAAKRFSARSADGNVTVTVTLVNSAWKSADSRWNVRDSNS
jgi:DNA-binding protein YbaB